MKSIQIYYKTHKQREKEKLFFTSICDELVSPIHVNEKYLVQEEDINNYLYTKHIITCLEHDKYLGKRKTEGIEILKTLPDKLKISQNSRNISFDIVIVNNNMEFYYEFHEKQHYSLKSKICSPIYDDKNNEYRIPRYLQRLLRDIWRVQYFPSLKIIWWDYFNEYGYKMELTNKFEEFYLKDKFSFTELLNTS